MNLLIVGATGGTGQQLVTQALERGHRVTALVRRQRPAEQRPGLTMVLGDVLDPPSVDGAVQGQDAVLSALGHKRWLGHGQAWCQTVRLRDLPRHLGRLVADGPLLHPLRPARDPAILLLGQDPAGSRHPGLGPGLDDRAPRRSHQWAEAPPLPPRGARGALALDGADFARGRRRLHARPADRWSLRSKHRWGGRLAQALEAERLN